MSEDFTGSNLIPTVRCKLVKGAEREGVRERAEVKRHAGAQVPGSIQLTAYPSLTPSAIQNVAISVIGELTRALEWMTQAITVL